MTSPNVENNKHFKNFVQKVKESHLPPDGKTIFDLNAILKPFYYKELKPRIEEFNKLLIKEFGEKAPQFKVISNIDFQNSEQNRSFIQVLYQEKANEFNLLTSPFFMIESEITGISKFIISTFKEVSEIDKISNIYENHNELLKKFIDGFGTFLEKI
jgi:hypothetical protein